MSNKTLIISVIIILVAFAGVAELIRIRNQKNMDQLAQDQAQQQVSQIPTPTPTETPIAQSASSSPTTTPSTSPTATAECNRNFDQNQLNTAQVSIKNREVEINVKNFGVIKLAFYDTDAPKTAENFLRLANSGYYNCLTFHRVAKGFVIQGGDPNGNGSGGFSAFGKTFADELNPNTPSYQAGYKKGVLAMANSGPNTNGSQFFIMLADVALPHSYTIFGKVSSGLDVVDKIGAVDINPQLGPTDGSPKVPVVMTSVKITK